MRRRDISGIFFGSVAGSMLLPGTGIAQSCPIPGPHTGDCPSPEDDLLRAERLACITPTNSQYPPLDVRRYGAAMDGCTADDEPLRQAIEVAKSVGEPIGPDPQDPTKLLFRPGGEIFIPAGTLRITTPKILPLKTTLKGLGRSVSRIKVDGAFAGFTVSTPTHDPAEAESHTRIEGIGFIGTSSSHGALHFKMVNYVLVRDCAFSDFVGPAYGIQMTQCYIWGVEHCFFKNIGGAGLTLVPAPDSNGQQVGCNQGVFGPCNEVIGNDRPNFIGVSVNTSQNITITGNDFEGSTNGNKAIDLSGSEGVFITNNYIEQWVGAAIAANSGLRNRRVLIMGNALHTVASRLEVCNFNNVASPNDNVVVALNRFLDLTPSQICAFVGTTTNFCEFNNDPDSGKITEAYQPSCVTARAMQGSASWNPPSIASGAVAAIDIGVSGAAFGDACIASFDKLLTNNILISAHVSALNIVRIVLFNKAATAVDLAAGTVRVKVFK